MQEMSALSHSWMHLLNAARSKPSAASVSKIDREIYFLSSLSWQSFVWANGLKFAEQGCQNTCYHHPHICIICATNPFIIILIAPTKWVEVKQKTNLDFRSSAAISVESIWSLQYCCRNTSKLLHIFCRSHLEPRITWNHPEGPICVWGGGNLSLFNFWCCTHTSKARLACAIVATRGFVLLLDCKTNMCFFSTFLFGDNKKVFMSRSL